jgi:hypothetical protein
MGGGRRGGGGILFGVESGGKKLTRSNQKNALMREKG